ncbi:MAG: FMN-binding protein [Methylotenera sp.]|nr:FMN-binding protein [Methylotenera sp.]MDI1310137.1 FMN-binding protein [Methylotenera sp.]
MKQYHGADLQKDYQLDKNMDGISGATLSVRAMGKMVR